jgi:RNA polymerase sigma factor (sigma-70 family)
MQYKTFPWNEWIALLLAGDEAPFFEGLMKAVNGAACFRGKNTSEVHREYGLDAREEIFGKLALKMWEGLIDEFRTRAYSDSHIAAYIMKTIKNMSTDLYEKQQRMRFVALPGADAAGKEGQNREGAAAVWKLADARPTPEAELQNRELDDLLKKIATRFTPRQVAIFDEYKAFDGELSGAQLAARFGISIQRINQEIAQIKKVIRAAAVDVGFSPLRTDRASQATSRANEQLTQPNGDQENVVAG